MVAGRTLGVPVGMMKGMIRWRRTWDDFAEALAEWVTRPLGKEAMVLGWNYFLLPSSSRFRENWLLCSRRASGGFSACLQRSRP